MAYHFLDLELDILQAPFEIRYLDGHDAIVRGDLDRPGPGHRRREVDDEHRGCVLKESVTKAGILRGRMVTPARSAGMLDDVAPKNPELLQVGWSSQTQYDRVLVTCSVDGYVSSSWKGKFRRWLTRASFVASSTGVDRSADTESKSGFRTHPPPPSPPCRHLPSRSPRTCSRISKMSPSFRRIKQMHTYRQ